MQLRICFCVWQFRWGGICNIFMKWCEGNSPLTYINSDGFVFSFFCLPCPLSCLSPDSITMKESQKQTTPLNFFFNSRFGFQGNKYPNCNAHQQFPCQRLHLCCNLLLTLCFAGKVYTHALQIDMCHISWLLRNK